MKTKVAFFMSSLGGGGAERVMLHLLRNLNREKFNPQLVLFREEGAYEDGIPGDVEVYRTGPNRARYNVLPLIKIIREVEPDILFSTLAHVDIPVVLAEKLSGVSTKVILRSPNFPSKSMREVQWGVRKGAGWSYRSANLVVASTNAMADDIIDRYSVNPDKLTVINNPVDLRFIEQQLQEEVDHPWINSEPKNETRDKVIIGMGRLTKQKGFRYLIKAVANVNDKISARLIILGEGKMEEELKELSQVLGVNDRVDFPGFIDNPYKYIAKADVFVLSSLWEGFPNALVEAMACGVPVVSTDCKSGPSEIIEDGKNGILMPERDVDGLSTAILHILENKDLSRELAEMGKRRVQDFSIKRIVKQYEEVFQWS